MKQRVKILIVVAILGCGWDTVAQVVDEGKIKIEITKDVNGEKRTFKGEYNSTEEMKADPSYQEFAGKDEDFHFWMDRDADQSQMFFNQDHLRSLQDALKFFENDEKGNHFFFKHFDSEGDDDKFFFRHQNGESSEQFFDLDFDDMNFEEYREKMKELGLEMETLLDKFQDFDPNNRVIIHIKKVEVTDVEGDEFGKKGNVTDSNKLELDELRFSPNPSSNGRFKVQFKVLEKKDLTIRVFNLEGKEVFNRYFERFGGMFSETIDLSGQKEGIYLLEITQGNKRLTKKIAIN
jgi:hypothetical protein